MPFLTKSIEDIFTSCSLHILPTAAVKRDDFEASCGRSERKEQQENNDYRAAAYYHDGSRERAKVVVPMLLKFENSLDRDRMISSGIVRPNPVDLLVTEELLQDLTDGNSNEEDDNGNGAIRTPNDTNPTSSLNARDRHLWHSSIDTIGFLQEDELELDDKQLQLKFECIPKTGRTTGKDGSINAFVAADVVVEGVEIVSTQLVDLSVLQLQDHHHNRKATSEEEKDTCGIRFDVEITLRTLTNTEEEKDDDHHGAAATTSSITQAVLEIRSILECSYKTQQKGDTTYPPFLSPRDHHTTTDDASKPIDDLYLGMQALNFATEVISPDQVRTIRLDETQHRKQQPVLSYFYQTKTYTLPPHSSQTDTYESRDSIPPPTLIVDLIPALFVSFKEVSGGALPKGVTLISLGMYHSNLHKEPVVITNIALHPGHSRFFDKDAFYMLNNENLCDTTTAVTTSTNSNSCNNSDNNSNSTNGTDGIKGGEQAVINMTKHVRWGYVPGTAPTFPLILNPNEAFATVIEIHANEVMAQRSFISPICVRAVVGHTDFSSNKSSCLKTEVEGNHTSHVIVTVDAKWSTCAIAVGPTDAFRVNLAVGDSICQVGAQVTVSLKITNLSLGARDLMLIMAKDECDAKVEDKLGDSGLEESTISKGTLTESQIQFMSQSVTSSNKERTAVNDAVVYEVNNYTFGAWGLGENDDGTIRHSRDHDLLAVDAALLLGEVRGQMSVESELRFVALRDGMLNVPNFKLYDRIHEKWYDCPHNLKIVAMKRQ